MIKLITFTAVTLLALALGTTSAPIPPAEVASFDLLTAELELQIKKLAELLGDEAKFDDQQEKIVQAAGVISCLSQAAIEHSDYKTAKYHAPALRDAGLVIQNAGDYAESIAGLELAEKAWQGEADSEHEADYEWGTLMGMYELMEEMNDRNGGLSRSLRRSRGKLEEKLNASTNAILAIEMLANHDYVSDEEDEKQWDDLSVEYQQAMTSLIAAIDAKDQEQIAAFYKAGNHACDTCHEKFRD